MKRIDLSSLNTLNAEVPGSLIAQIRLAMPDVETALRRGHRLRDVHLALNNAGIKISYRLLSCYLRRIRKEPESRLPPRPGEAKPIIDAKLDESQELLTPSLPPGANDPLFNLRQRKTPRTFEYPSGPPDESKLI